MIQLGYYSQSQQAQHDESNDFENYDPSEFLMKKEEPAYENQPAMAQEPMQYQEPYYSSNVDEGAGGDDVQPQTFYGSFSHESFSASEYNFQQPQMTQLQEDMSQQQPIIQDGGGLDDLDISDSDDDDEDQNAASTSQNQADTSKDDDDGLWF
jgi:hypothetical protein